MKYHSRILDLLMVYPKDSNIKEKGNISANPGQDIANLIADGYEIYSAIPYSTSDTCGIQYILRKKI